MEKTHGFRLSEQVVKTLADRHGTPILVLSLAEIEANYRMLRKHLPGVTLYYAMKANPDQRLVRRLADIGSSFDVASDGEILTLAEMGVTPHRMVYANPVKTMGGFAACKKTGVRKFTFDSTSEISKMAASVPNATVLLRIRIDNTGAHVDLNKKFGASPADAVALLSQAKASGLDAAGLCFHVGSQTTSAAPYLEALRLARRLFNDAAEAGLDLRILDIGGGFPIPTTDMDFDRAEMLDMINQEVEALFPDTEIWAEPGRFICGTAVNLITRVIGVSERNGQPWYFLDDGLYGTFSGVIFDHWDYELIPFKEGFAIPSTFAGPSCDSLDIMFRDKPMPPLVVDDILLVPNCGAYTSASATVFNGFAKTEIFVWEELKETLMTEENFRLACAG